jgi:hypothetical protein
LSACSQAESLNFNLVQVKVNVFNPTGTKKEGPSFQSSKPVCPIGREPRQRFERVQNPDGTWKTVATGEWTWSADNDAIKVYYADGVSLFSTNAAADCQLDDQFKFSANGDFMYESNGQTYTQSTGSCDVPRANATGYKVITSSTQAPRIVLNGTPFFLKEFLA